jgi:uncharacterized membrane protein YhaH (DUF805 family)
VGLLERDEPLARDRYVRPALLWLAIPTFWLLLVFRLQTGMLPAQGVSSFVVVWVPYLLAFLVFVSLSMRRLRDLGAPRAVAWLSLLPGAALPLYLVLAVVPSPTRTTSGTQ